MYNKCSIRFMKSDVLYVAQTCSFCLCLQLFEEIINPKLYRFGDIHREQLSECIQRRDLRRVILT